MTVIELLCARAKEVGGKPTAEELADSLSVERYRWPPFDSPAYAALLSFRKLACAARVQAAKRALAA